MTSHALMPGGIGSETTSIIMQNTFTVFTAVQLHSKTHIILVFPRINPQESCDKFVTQFISVHKVGVLVSRKYLQQQ